MTATLVAASPANADLLVNVDKATQTMTVSVDGVPRYVWPVSTGIAAYDTPDGDFKPFRMEKDHFSKEWDDAPMPYSIFFTKQGHAIHGTNHTSIGRPASHGCVRLNTKNAAILWGLVKEQKMANTRVVLTGELPASTEVPVARRQRKIQPVYSGDDLDDEQISAAVSARQQRRSDWRAYNDGQAYYYQQTQPYVAPRYYGEPAPRYYGEPVRRGLFGGW
jgi:hypothetical protein